MMRAPVSAGLPVATPPPAQNKIAVTEVDNDGDGWTVSQGDCCDVALAGCPQPALVNPGAFEVPGNGVDDDCDGVIDNAQPVCDTSLASNASDPLAYAQAIDLCQTSTENPLLPQRKWGVISGQFLLADGTGTPAPAAFSRSIRQSFGANTTQFGSSFAVLSTGRAAATGQMNPNFASFQPGQIMGTQSAFPSDWLAANGNTLPTVTGCPAPGPNALDPIMLKLRIRVPTNAHSFSVSTRMFSAEYPEWTCSAYNDYYLALLDSTFSGSPANPADKNIATYPAPDGHSYLIGTGHAYANTGLFQACKNGETGCAPGAVPGATTMCTGTSDLAGTGFEIMNPPSGITGVPGYCGTNNLLGGGTAWLTTTGNVVPGETIELRFILWDATDAYYDSVALLDNFQWSIESTTPGTFITGQVPRPQIAPSAPTGVAASAQSQTSVAVAWNAAASATSYQVFRRGPGETFGQVGTVSGPSFMDVMAMPNTSYLYRVRAVNDVGPSPDSTSNLATTLMFSNDPLAAGTLIRAVHLSELRSAVSAVRQLAGLAPAVFTDSASAGVLVRAVHVTEIRSALDEALTTLGFGSGAYTDAVAAGILIKAVHSQEIRNRVK
jgi:hypothetical protein